MTPEELTTRMVADKLLRKDDSASEKFKIITTAIFEECGLEPSNLRIHMLASALVELQIGNYHHPPKIVIHHYENDLFMAELKLVLTYKDFYGECTQDRIRSLEAKCNELKNIMQQMKA